jgi:hypothetical protein
MQRYKALFKETWWLWSIFLTAGILLSWMLSKIFLLIFPISVFVFFWFAWVRYDEDGTFLGT